MCNFYFFHLLSFKTNIWSIFLISKKYNLFFCRSTFAEPWFYFLTACPILHDINHVNTEGLNQWCHVYPLHSKAGQEPTKNPAILFLQPQTRTERNTEVSGSEAYYVSQMRDRRTWVQQYFKPVWLRAIFFFPRLQISVVSHLKKAVVRGC